MISTSEFTPRQIVTELDKYIIGQDDAKRAVAIAVRNRWRRQQLPEEIREEVAPKNIIMAGPTGVGKTEIARRLAALVGAPFVKIEATKFTEVGYVGRDVESMIRDLVERAINMVRDEQAALCSEEAERATEERILDYLLPRPLHHEVTPDADGDVQDRYERTRNKLREQLRKGDMEERPIEIMVEEKAMPINILSNVGMDQMDPEMQNFFDKLMPSKAAPKRMAVQDARKVIRQQELDKLVDHDKVVQTAIARTENSGVIFLDEIDKICSGGNHAHAEVSREGVQRDLLPLVEGTTVNTRHGLVRSDHILFIAAGAFSRNKPSDLMPELQGRFPIRVKLSDLDQEQFRRILTEPRNSLTTQQIALLETEGVKLEFTDDGVAAMAERAFHINSTQQNIGARRLYAVMEKVLDEISFEACDSKAKKYVIDSSYVNEHLRDAHKDEDLNVFGFAAKSPTKDK
jgi:ATP-dependent HslUV protease ATP-binding subunit HslU